MFFRGKIKAGLYIQSVMIMRMLLMLKSKIIIWFLLRKESAMQK